MKRSLWGEFEDGSDRRQQTKPDEIILPLAKAEKLKKGQELALKIKEQTSKVEITSQNPLVTQTVEIMNQTEIIQTLIDTYAKKNGLENHLVNPNQMIPEIAFPSEITADVSAETKFAKPLWFIPPIDTDFSKGKPESYPLITKEICKSALRKSLCGLLRVVGYTDAYDSALLLFADSVEEFINNLLNSARDVQVNESKDKENRLDIITLEKSYYSLMHTSLLSIYNYYRNEIVTRNRVEHQECREIYHEYDKLKKESEMKQEQIFRQEDFSRVSFIGPLMGTEVQQENPNINLVNLLEAGNQHSQQSSGYKETIEIQNPSEQKQHYTTSQQICE